MEKVLVLTSSFPRFEGDFSGNFIYDLVKELSKRFKIKVLAPSDNIKWKDKVGNIKVERFNYCFRRLQRLAYGNGMPYNIKHNLLAKLQVPFFMLSYFLKSLRMSKEYEIINSHWLLPSGLIGALIKRIKGKKHVTTVHSADLHILRRLPFKKMIMKFILRNCDIVTAVSNYTKEAVLRLSDGKFKEKIKVLPMGVEIEGVKKNKAKLRKDYGIKEKNVILFIGRLAKIKGVEYLIRAMKNVKDSLLVIAGFGELENELKELVKNLNVNAKFVGFVKGKKKEDYLQLCDFVVVPSIILSSGREEGLPVVILEALANGKAVIATKVGGINDAVKDGYNGFLVRDKDENALREKINILINNSKELKRLNSNALKSSKRFDIKKIGKEYGELIGNI